MNFLVTAGTRLRQTASESAQLVAFGRSAGAIAGGTVVVQGLGLITGLITARVLGPVGRGDLALAMLLPSILAFIGDLGIDRAAAYFSARPQGIDRTFNATVLVLGLGLGAISAALAAIIGSIVLGREHPGLVLPTVTAAIIVLLSIESRLGQALLQGSLRMRRLAVARISEPSAYFVGLTTLLAASHLTVWTAVAARLAAQIPIIAIAWAPFLSSVGAKPNPATASGLIRFGLGTLPLKLSPADVFQVDQWVVGLTLGPKELGYYVVALSMLAPTRLIPFVISTVLLPSVAARRELPLKTIIAGGLLLSAGTAVALVVTLDVLIGGLFGHSYAAAVRPAQILAVGSVAMCGRELMVATAIGSGHPRTAGGAEIVSAIVLVIGVLTLPRVAGLSGAALAMSAGYFAGFAFLLIFPHRVARTR